ncbi:MAG: DUF2726 domain-containing protein [Rhodoferax sp.]|nr:DUF2726 domain-containing protein [Rhodoferax sp.]
MLIWFLVGALSGIAIGGGLVYWRQKFALREQRRIPREWPLKLRLLVNSRERRVWIWLTKVMFDQQVLIKLPVTRFTTPAVPTEANHWYKILNGLYCSFTVCDADGRVIGCVDVPGPQGLSMSNQTLKHTLLAQCGVRYWVVDPDNLPHLAQIRTAFLGEHAVKGVGRDDLEMRFRNVRENLQAAVTRQRAQTNSGEKSSGFARLDAAMSQSSDTPESRLPSGWDHNSFITPLDSRSGELNH